MELKPVYAARAARDDSELLIVLNGIETRLARYYATVQYILLIVLNGIETNDRLPVGSFIRRF